MPPNAKDSLPSPTAVSSGAPNRKCLRFSINGMEYQISEDWARKHPGGRVIFEFDGKDASDVFVAFHSKKAYDLLEQFKKNAKPVENPIPESAEEKDFRNLLKYAADQGLMKRSVPYYIWKTSSNAALFLIVGALCMMFPGQTWAIVVATLILGCAMSQCGWLAHDYLHHQVFQNRKYNNLMGLFVGGVLQGFSPTWWKDKHNTHHALCNVYGADPDIDTVPLVAWSELDFPAAEKQTAFWRVWMRNQTYLFPIVLCLAQSSWRLQSIQYACSERSRDPIGERISILIHYLIIAFYTYSISNTFVDAIMFLVLQEIFGSYGKALPFVLNHGGLPVVSREHKWSYFRLQVNTSRDVEPGLLADYFMGGLNYQIEHHIFPTMPRHNLGKIKSKVRELCLKHKMVYTNTTFLEGMRGVIHALQEVAAAFAADLETKKIH